MDFSPAHGPKRASIALDEHFLPSLHAAWALVGSLAQLSHAELLINEVMYHAASGNRNEQYIEVINTASTAIDLTGWRLSGAVDFSITEGTIAGNGFWVIVADRAAFHAKYTAVTNYAGPWTGSLDGSSSVKLHTAAGATANTVHYNTEGDWSERRIGPLDQGASGWEWISDHDGRGSSLELINPLRSTQVGQNWDASTARDGTPGRANSVAQFDSAPFIQDVAHRPVVPSASDSVTIVAKITDEIGSAPPVAKLYWRLDSVPTTGFQEVALFDDGAHGDGAAGDGSYGAILPPYPTNTVIEYYLTAIDISGHLRTYPRTIPQNERTANLLYQVDTATRSDRRPLYRIILTTAEKTALDLVESAHPDSDAASSGAVVVQDGTGTAIRQLVTFRNRGHGTRRHDPHNIKVKLPADQPLSGRTNLNLNAAYPYCHTTWTPCWVKATPGERSKRTFSE